MPEDLPTSAPPRVPPSPPGGVRPGAREAGGGPRGRRRLGLLARTVLLALLVLVLSATAVLIFPDQLLLPWLLPAARAAASSHGLQLSVEHLSGGFSDTLELRGLHLATTGGALPPARLDVPLAELRWSPWRALIGAPDALDGLSLHGGTLTVDLSRGLTPSGEPWPRHALADLGRRLDALPALSVDSLALDVRAPSAGWLDAPLLAVHGTLRVDGRLVLLTDGALDGDGPGGRLPGGLALRAPARFDLSQLARDELPFALDVAALGGALAVQGALRADALEVHAVARDLPLPALHRALGGGAESPPLAGVLQLEGDVRLPLALAAPHPAGLALDVAAISADARFTLGATAGWGLSLDAARGSLAWAGGTLRVTDAQLQSGDNHVAIEDATLPPAVLAGLSAASWETVPWDALEGSVRVDAGDVPALLGALHDTGALSEPLTARAEGLLRRLVAPAVAGEHRLQVRASLHDGTLSVRDGLLRTTGGSLSVPAASLDLRAADLADAALAVRLDADFADLSPLSALLGEAPLPGSRSSAWAGTLAARVRFSGSVRAPVAELEIGGHDLVASGWPLGAVTVVAVADARELRVDALEIQAAGAHVAAQGALDLSSFALRAVSAQVTVPDLAAALPGTGLAGALSSRLALDGPLPLPLGTLELHVHELVAHGVPVEDLDLFARHEPGLLHVADATLRAPWGALRTAGELRFTEPLPDLSPAAWLDAVQDVRLDRLALARGSLELRLVEPAALRHSGGRWIGPLAFTGSAGGLRVTLGSAAAVSGGGTLQRVQLVAENLQPLLALPSGSSVDTLDGDVDVVFGPGELSAKGTLRALGLSLAADDTELGARVAGDVTAWLAVTGSADAPRGTVELSAKQLVLSAPGRLAPQGFGPCTLDAHVTLGELLSVDWLHLDSPHEIHLDAAGTLQLPAHPRADWPDTAVHLRLSASAGKLDRLAELITDVRRLSGDIAAELTLDGTLGHPLAHGSVVVHDGELRLAGPLPPLDALEARLEWQVDRLAIVELTGELGFAPFTIGGEVLLTPDGPSLDITLRGEDLLFYRAEGVTVRADSDLAVRGPLSALRATGTLVLRNSGVVSSLNLLHFAQGGGHSAGMRLFGFREPPLSTCAFDVRVTAAEPFLVRNNVVRGGLRPDLRLTGTGQTPILDGTLTVERSRVVLPAGSVNIDGGRVLFSAAEPATPRLDIAGSDLLRGYDVTVLITGPYDAPVVRLSSVPPLPSEKILLLLLAGQAPGRGAVGPAGSDTTTHVVAVYLGQDLMARWLGDSPLGEEGLLDRLEVDVVKDISRSNTDLFQVSYRLTEMPKREGTVTFLRAEKDLYNRINFGVQFLFRLDPSP